MKGEDEKRITRVVTPNEDPQKTEKIKMMMVAMSSALLPFDPSVDEILSALATLQAFVMAKSGESIERIRKTLRDAEDTMVDMVLRERGDQR